MIHFGIKKMERNILFTEKCYYPFSFSEERSHLKPIFGASFGFFWNENSICVAMRPSENHLDKIDIFTKVCFSGICLHEYAGNVDVNQNYLIQLLFNRQASNYSIRIYPIKGFRPVINFISHYPYPVWNMGFTKENSYDNKIILSK